MSLNRDENLVRDVFLEHLREIMSNPNLMLEVANNTENPYCLEGNENKKEEEKNDIIRAVVYKALADVSRALQDNYSEFDELIFLSKVASLMRPRYASLQVGSERKEIEKSSNEDLFLEKTMFLDKLLDELKKIMKSEDNLCKAVLESGFVRKGKLAISLKDFEKESNVGPESSPVTTITLEHFLTKCLSEKLNDIEKLKIAAALHCANLRTVNKLAEQNKNKQQRDEHNYHALTKLEKSDEVNSYRGMVKLLKNSPKLDYETFKRKVREKDFIKNEVKGEAPHENKKSPTSSSNTFSEIAEYALPITLIGVVFVACVAVFLPVSWPLLVGIGTIIAVGALVAGGVGYTIERKLAAKQIAVGMEGKPGCDNESRASKQSRGDFWPIALEVGNSSQFGINKRLLIDGKTIKTSKKRVPTIQSPSLPVNKSTPKKKGEAANLYVPVNLNLSHVVEQPTLNKRRQAKPS